MPVIDGLQNFEAELTHYDIRILHTRLLILE